MESIKVHKHLEGAACQGEESGLCLSCSPGVFQAGKAQTFGSVPSQRAHISRERTEETFLLVFNRVYLGGRGTFGSYVCILEDANRAMNTLPLDKTMSPLTPHSSTTAPGTGGPVGPLSPPLEHLLLQENTQTAETIQQVPGETSVIRAK